MGDGTQPDGERQSVRGAGDDGRGFDAGFANVIANEVQVGGVAEVGELGPFGFEEFEPVAGVDEKIYFAGALELEKEAAGAVGEALAGSQLGEYEGFPDGSNGRGMRAGLLRSGC